mgnify:CR=1 FL=1
MKEIETREDISSLVNIFYNKIRKIMRKTIPGTKTENSELVLGIFVLIIKT